MVGVTRKLFCKRTGGLRVKVGAVDGGRWTVGGSCDDSGKCIRPDFSAPRHYPRCGYYLRAEATRERQVSRKYGKSLLKTAKSATMKSLQVNILKLLLLWTPKIQD